MAPAERQHSPFLDRINDLARRWVQDEWAIIEAIKRDAARNGKSANHSSAIEESTLTPDNLAKRLDNISLATLRRELKRLNAPTPGEIIRKTRIDFAKHLFTHTRILVRNVALRAGYSDERYFARIFHDEVKCLPSDFRRLHAKKSARTGTRRGSL